MATGQFELSLRQFAAKARADMDTVVRQATIQLATNIVMRSPVGNPELWAANAHAMAKRAGYNAAVDAANEGYAAQGLKKRIRKASAKTLAKTFPLASGKGYVGGRFRANWQLTADAPASGALEDVDPTGNATVGKVTKLASAMRAGGLIYLTNNLPYGPRLEYEGWSKQAPAGMVGVTMVEANDIVSAAAKAL